jgi:hypothetical protein
MLYAILVWYMLYVVLTVAARIVGLDMFATCDLGLSGDSSEAAGYALAIDIEEKVYDGKKMDIWVGISVAIIHISSCRSRTG